MSRPQFSSPVQRPGDEGASTEGRFIGDTIEFNDIADGTSMPELTAIDPVDGDHIFHSANAVIEDGTWAEETYLMVRIREPTEGITLFERRSNLANLPIDPNTPIPLPDGHEITVRIHNESGGDISGRIDVSVVEL